MRQVYRSSFEVGPGVNIEAIVEESKEWVGRKIGDELGDEFYSGTSLESGDSILDTVSAAAEGTKGFAMKYTHPDSEQKNRRWRTNFAVIGSDDSPIQVEINLETGFTDGVVRPETKDFARPALTRRIVSKFPCENSRFRLFIRPFLAAAESVPILAEMINSEHRKLPLVLISRDNREGKCAVDPGEIADQLVGLAFVWEEKNPHVSRKLAEHLDPSLNCYDGAIRLYWPMGKKGDELYFSRYWQRGEIASHEDFPRYLLRFLSQFSVSNDHLVGFEDIRRINLRQRIEQLRNAGELSELAEVYAQENDSLKAQIEEFREREATYQGEIMQLKAKGSALEDALSRKPAEIAKPAVEKIPSFSSVNEAVGYYMERHHPNTLFFHNKALKGAAANTYHNPNQVGIAFGWLAADYRKIRSGKASGSLEESCLSETGMEYAASENYSTMRQFPHDYFVDVDGVRYELREHLKKGNTKDPRASIRIMFAYDKEKGRVIIGNLLAHPKNKKS